MDKGKSIRMSFLNYFDGCYGIEPNTPSTYEMGICGLDYHGISKRIL